jgi:3-oxoacyl-[acyl-carrier protein] reductase
MKDEEWASVIATNLNGVFFLTKEAVAKMMRRRYGRIINVSSVVGQMGNPGQANYVSSKAGVIGFTKAVAREVASRNITVNAIAPGYITTPMTESLGDKAKQDLLGMVPLGRMGTVDDIAKGVLFLASEEAGYITGHVLNINGGMYM